MGEPFLQGAPRFYTKQQKGRKNMKLTEKSAYIKGLAAGLELDQTGKEGKILAALLELVDELAQEVADLRTDVTELDEGMDDLHDYVEELDDDLDAVEEFLDGEDDDEDDDDDECGTCEGCSGCDNEEYYEIVCPSCGETVCFDQELDPEALVCPACGEKFGCIVEEEDYQKLSEKTDRQDG